MKTYRVLSGPRRQRLITWLTLIVVLAGGASPNVDAQALGPESLCAPNTGSGSITGQVSTSAATPANFVTVAAYTEYGQYATGTTTSASGVYTLTNLVAGSYLLRFSPGTGTDTGEWYNNQATGLTATPISVTRGAVTPNINVQLDPGGRISGTLTAEGGAPVPFSSVAVIDQTGSQVARASTNAGGLYVTSPGLPSGDYRVYFEGSGPYLPEYYDNQSNPDTATSVSITAPVTTVVNAQLAVGGQISGTVTNAATGLPVPSAQVIASGPNSAYGYTDSDGRYLLAGLPTGDYEIRASTPFGDTGLIAAVQTATVTAGATLPGVNFALAQGATLSGRVTGPGGAPLNGIVLFVGASNGDYQEYVSTNATGVYTATGLSTGQYLVYFRPSDDYVPEAYNDHVEFGSADPISVTAPAAVNGIDAELAPGSSIAGTVIDAETGQPVPDIFVEILSLSGGRVESAFTQADGSYQTPSTLAAGDYLVRFNSDRRFASCAYVTEYYVNQYDIEGAAPVSVGAGTAVTNINGALSRGSLVFGRLTDAGSGAPIPQGVVRFIDSQGEARGFARVYWNGGYASEGGLPTGPYRVLFEDYDLGYVDEYYNDKPTLAAADTITLTAPANRQGLDAALTRGGLISGRVTDAGTGNPVPYSLVVVYSATGDEVGRGYPDQNGEYTVITGIPAGLYRVFAVGQPEEGQAVTGLAADPFDFSLQTELLAGSGYLPSPYRAGTLPGPAVLVSVTAGLTTPDIDIALLRGALLPLIRK